MDTTITNLKSILLKKKMNIDCTEEESAEIKGFFRELKKQVDLSNELSFFFPIEYSEFLLEIED